ncbi:PDZ domain-containing protein [Sinomicrobium soli]|uniref:PDZ domain-containing protein n=1 Tax=Sinomicrobium sp. N-1-3-6 TaxID=2219864 RepID=UPI001374EC02|nr:PDZ domain-containing protein [Sinomicrobium sp. N-1-3-6]
MLKNIRNIIPVGLLLLLGGAGIRAQSGFELVSGGDYHTVKFSLVNNLVIIPVEVNGVELSFILDSGVNKPILFDLGSGDHPEFSHFEAIYIRGLGQGEAIKAYRSRDNVIRINEKVVNRSSDFYLILDQGINFAPRLGIPIHGIIGFEVFRDLVVDISYTRKRIRFYRPGTYRHRTCRKCHTFGLDMIHNKPYLKAEVAVDGRREEVKLLVDSGSSDALWLFDREDNGLSVPQEHFDDFLGRGLSGSVYGSRARVEELHLGDFEFKDAKVAFPDAVSLQHLQNLSERDGSIGGEILRRFDVVVDYAGKKMTMKRNRYFRQPFKYNMSGIELQHNGMRIEQVGTNSNQALSEHAEARKTYRILPGRLLKYSLYPAFEIAEVRNGSPACDAGLKKGDVVLSVNGKRASGHSIQEMMELMNVRAGKKIRLLVEREGRQMRFMFRLKEVL